MFRSNDILGIIRGLQLVAEAGLTHQRSEFNTIWRNSSIRALVEDALTNSNVTNTVLDKVDRVATVCHGLQVYTTHAFTEKGKL